MSWEAIIVGHVYITTSQTRHNVWSIRQLDVETLYAPQSVSASNRTRMQKRTHVVIGALVESRNVKHLSSEIVLNLANE